MSDSLIESRHLPDDWILTNLASISLGGAKNGYFKKPSLVGRGYKLINVSELYQKFGIDLTLPTVERVEASPSDYKKYKVADGDIFFTRSSLVLSGIAECNIIRKVTEPSLFECHVMKVTLDKAKVSSEFVAYCCRDSFARSYLMSRAKQTTMTTISQPEIENLPVPVPPLPQQRKIARILTTVDSLIEKTEALIAKYQSIKQGMMHDLFTRGVDSRGHLRPPYEEAPELYKQSDLGWIPKEWEVRKLGEITFIVRGSSPRPKGDSKFYGGSVPRLMVEDVTRDGKFVTPQVDFLTETGAALSRPMPAGSLTLVCSGTVGVPAFLVVDACIHDGFLGFREISDCCLPDYLYQLFVFLKGRMDTIATHGGIFTNLTTSIVKNLLVPLPSKREQKAVDDKLSQCDQVIAVEEKALSKQKLYKAGLMQDLLAGKVRVKVDEADEVAAHA